MSVLEDFIAYADRYLDPPVLASPGAAFELSIGDEESVAYEALDRLIGGGIGIPSSMREALDEEFGDSWTFAELLEDVKIVHEVA